jgi:hypothetical protein
MDAAITGAILGAVLTIIVLGWFIVNKKPVKCASCGREQPKMRQPDNMDQAMWGGYTCAGCGASLDAKGNVKAK